MNIGKKECSLGDSKDELARQAKALLDDRVIFTVIAMVLVFWFGAVVLTVILKFKEAGFFDLLLIAILSILAYCTYRLYNKFKKIRMQAIEAITNEMMGITNAIHQ